MVILPVSREITMPSNDKYQFLIMCMEVIKEKLLNQFDIFNALSK